MCDTIDHRRESTGKSIVIEFERDPSLRATEVVIVNQDRDGDERQAVKVICADSGKIMYVGKVQDLADGVDVV